MTPAAIPASLTSSRPRRTTSPARDARLPGQGAHRVPGRQHDRLGVQRASQAGRERALAGGDLEDVLAEPGVVHRVEAVLAAVRPPAVLHPPAAGGPPHANAPRDNPRTRSL